MTSSPSACNIQTNVERNCSSKNNVRQCFSLHLNAQIGAYLYVCRRAKYQEKQNISVSFRIILFLYTSVDGYETKIDSLLIKTRL